MVNRPPEFCPYCGTELEAVDPPTVHRCAGCADYVFHNPTPGARVVVLDGDAVLLVTRPDGKWILPGGKVEVGNDPAEHAAIELAEETSLSVAPEALTLFDAATYEVLPERHSTSVFYAVDAAATSGELAAGSDAGKAAFQSLTELERLDTFPEYGRLRERIDGALAALES